MSGKTEKHFEERGIRGLERKGCHEDQEKMQSSNKPIHVRGEGKGLEDSKQLGEVG